MPPAGRLGDKSQVPADAHGCPACPHPAIGPAIGGSPNVNINSRPALRVGDPGVHSACCGPNTWSAAMGSQTVFINGEPAHRMNDMVRHCGSVGKLIEGSPNVFVGGPPSAGGRGAPLDAPREVAKKPLAPSRESGLGDPDWVELPGYESESGDEGDGGGGGGEGTGRGGGMGGIDDEGNPIRRNYLDDRRYFDISEDSEGDAGSDLDSPASDSGSFLPSQKPATAFDAPDELNLNGHLSSQMQDHFTLSFPDGKATEYGATLVMDADGNLSFVNPKQGIEGQFTADLEIPDGYTLVGITHTHPYNESDGSPTNVSFSGGDAAWLVNTGKDVILVQSGEGQFVYLRTEQTPDQVDTDFLNKWGNDRVTELMNNESGPGLSFDAATRQAAAEMAQNYGIAYYEGKNGKLKKVGGP